MKILKCASFFAGVGGIDKGFEQNKLFKIVYANEYDSYPIETYELNSNIKVDRRDIHEVQASEIPDFDVMLAGFPCQAFSIAGNRKGFDDEKGRGTLFFELVRIIKVKKPQVIFLENVKNLVGHDKGNTFSVIIDELKKEGYKVAVISFMDGSLKEEYKKEGIPVLVYNSKYINEELIDVLSRYFGTWFINTLVLWTFVAYAKNRHIKVIWWMHENEQFYQIMQKEYCKLVKTKNMRFLAAGPYVQRMISTYMNTESEILNFGVKEERGTDAIQAYYNEHNIVRFLLAGTLSSLKGIDILAEAIRTLPEVYHERSEYIFVGNMSTAEEGILEDLLTLDNEYDNVKIYDSLNHDDIYRLYDKVSVVVVPSRLEPTSAVAVEGLMKRKICICTDICGVSYYLENGKNAIIIPAGNSEVLAEKIKYVIDNVADLKYMCDAGYEVYKSVYSMECLENSWKNVMKEWDNQPLEPSLDIIIYNYNDKAGLMKTLRCVYDTFYNNMHVVVIDDASQEDCLECIEKEYGDKENLMYIQNDEHIGEYKSFIYAYNSTESEFCSYISSGTCIEANYYNGLVACIQDNNCVGVCSKRLMVKGGKIIETGYNKDKITLDDILAADSICFKGIVFRRNIVKNIPDYEVEYKNMAFERLYIHMAELGNLMFCDSERIADV